MTRRTCAAPCLGAVLATVFWLLLWALMPLDTGSRLVEQCVCPAAQPPSSRPLNPPPTDIAEAPAVDVKLSLDLSALAPITEDIDVVHPDRIPNEVREATEVFLMTLNTTRGAVRYHANFSALRRFVLVGLHEARATAVMQQAMYSPSQNSTECFEFFRTFDLTRDDILRVPCVPLSLDGLASVEMGAYGVIAAFSHRRLLVEAVPPIRVAVEMSGQMRTFAMCAATVKEHLLATTQGLLFVGTYPELGHKRTGVRVAEADDPLPLESLRELYGADHLASLYLVDLPTARQVLGTSFPTLFGLTQWSWMIYQLFMMELTHNLTEAHLKRHPPRLPPEEATTRRSWGGEFDVYVRIRPDLYIFGPIRFTRDPRGALLYHYSCGGSAYPPVELNETSVLRSTHHPVWLWPQDPLSDHSAIGRATSMGKFLRLFSDTLTYPPKMQEKRVFYHGQTAERLWSEHATRQGLHVRKVPGWHLMLRRADKFNNGTLQGSAFKKKLIRMIFGATDPHGIPCARPDNSNTVLSRPKKH